MARFFRDMTSVHSKAHARARTLPLKERSLSVAPWTLIIDNHPHGAELRKIPTLQGNQSDPFISAVAMIGVQTAIFAFGIL